MLAPASLHEGRVVDAEPRDRRHDGTARDGALVPHVDALERDAPALATILRRIDRRRRPRGAASESLAVPVIFVPPKSSFSPTHAGRLMDDVERSAGAGKLARDLGEERLRRPAARAVDRRRHALGTRSRARPASAQEKEQAGARHDDVGRRGSFLFDECMFIIMNTCPL